MRFLLLLLGKTVIKIMRLMGKNATTLPGNLVSRFSSNFISKLKLPTKVIFVTGTNGKTSTANLISDILITDNKTVINNSKGANLLSGITTLLIENSNMKGEVNADFAVFEIDESTLPKISKHIVPDELVITNFFRDQLDRHFEISQVMEKVKTSINPKTHLLINADDTLCVNLVSDLENKIQYYSMEKSSYSKKEEPMIREGRYCNVCKHKLTYKFFNYGHFGDYYCPNCGYKKPNVKYKVSNVNLDTKSFNVNGIDFTMQSNELYTIYNFTMGICLSLNLGIKKESIVKSVANFKLNNSRMEEFNIQNKKVKMNIVKNQIGFDSTVEAYLQDKGPKTFIYVLNNNYADSIDTSWIWDCDYSLLKDNNIKEFICTGMRRFELATRVSLENPNFKINVIENMEKAYDNIGNLEGNVYVISAYTANIATNKYLKQMEKNNA